MATRYYLTKSSFVNSDLKKTLVFDLDLRHLTFRIPKKAWVTFDYDEALKQGKKLVKIYKHITILQVIDGQVAVVAKLDEGESSNHQEASDPEKTKSTNSWSGVNHSDFNAAAVGAKIQEGRKQKGWKQSDLGDMLGVSASRISMLETGALTVNLAVLATVAKLVGIPLSELVAAGEVKEPKFFKFQQGHNIVVWAEDEKLPSMEYEISADKSAEDLFMYVVVKTNSTQLSDGTSSEDRQIPKEEYEKHLRLCLNILTESIAGKQRMRVKTDSPLDALTYEITSSRPHKSGVPKNA